MLSTLDNFKQANDVTVIFIGDEVLEHIAATIKKNIRSTDVAARMGGDAVHNIYGLPRTVEPQIKRIFESLPSTFKGFPIKVSMGVACYGRRSGLRHAVEMADKAAYSVKRSGKNFLSFLRRLTQGRCYRQRVTGG